MTDDTSRILVLHAELPAGRLQLTKPIALDDLIDGLDMLNDDMTAYLDRCTNAVVTIDREIVILSERDEPDEWADWQREMIEVVREVEKGSERYVQLPSQRDVHEWDIMRRFCDNVEDERLRQLLLHTIHGRGAFRRFKSELDREGLLDRWFDFKRNDLREKVIAWCLENDIPYA